MNANNVRYTVYHKGQKIAAFKNWDLFNNWWVTGKFSNFNIEFIIQGNKNVACYIANQIW